MDTPPTGCTTIITVDLGSVLARLDPLQQAAVVLVYFRGFSSTDAARIMAVEHSTLTAALAGTFRQLADWVLSEDGAQESLVAHAAAN